MTRVECICGDGPCMGKMFLDALMDERRRGNSYSTPDEIAQRVRKNYIDSQECLRPKELEAHILEVKQK